MTLANGLQNYYHLDGSGEVGDGEHLPAVIGEPMVVSGVVRQYWYRGYQTTNPAGVIGQCWEDWCDTSYARLGQGKAGALNPGANGDMSVSFWIWIYEYWLGSQKDAMCMGLTSGTYQWRFVWAAANSDFLGFDISQNGTNWIGGTNCRIQSAGIGAALGTSGFPRWEHIVLRYKRSTQLAEIIHNGDLAGKATDTIGIHVGDGAFWLGGNPWGVYAKTTFDELAAWDRVLTDAEVTALYNGGAAQRIALGADPALQLTLPPNRLEMTPPEDRLELTLPRGRIEMTLPDNRLDMTLPENRLEFTLPEIDE